MIIMMHIAILSHNVRALQDYNDHLLDNGKAIRIKLQLITWILARKMLGQPVW